MATRGGAGTEMAVVSTETLDAIAMKRQGYTYEEIGRRLGISKATAYRRVTRALQAAVDHDSRELRELLEQRLDNILRVQYPLMLAGDRDATVIVLQVHDRLARLWGVEIPQKVVSRIEWGSEVAV